MGGIYFGYVLFVPKIDVFLFAPRLGPIRFIKALGLLTSGMPHLSSLDTQAAILDTPHEKAQFCPSHGCATEFRHNHLALHTLPDTHLKREVDDGLTYQQFERFSVSS